MSNSIDIPTRDRRPRRMRYQESPFAQTQPQSPAPSADAGPAGSDAYSKANSEYGRLYVDSRSSLPSSSLYSTSSPFGTPSSYDAAVSSVDGSPAVPHAMSMAERRAHDKGKGRAVDGATASPTSPARGSVSERRTSFMGGTSQTLCRHPDTTDNSFAGESIARAEHTVIDIGDPDGTPRLVCYPCQLLVSIVQLTSRPDHVRQERPGLAMEPGPAPPLVPLRPQLQLGA